MLRSGSVMVALALALLLGCRDKAAVAPVGADPTAPADSPASGAGDELNPDDLTVGDEGGDAPAEGDPGLSTAEVTALLAEQPLACPPGTARQQQVGEEGLREVWCQLPGSGDAEPQREGPYRSWNADGTKDTEGVYRAGAKNGLWRRWYRSGQLAEQCHYQGNVRHGRCETWSAEGRREQDMEYWNGKPTR